MKLLVNFVFCFWFSSLASLAHADRIKDLASLAGVRNNQLVGYGLVVGLSGTGDANPCFGAFMISGGNRLLAI